MASANLIAELKCSICWELYTDPVMLKCGHNFCRVCIQRTFDTQEQIGSYFCPECKQSSRDRPVLERNRKLRNIVENFSSTYPDEEEFGVPCSYCIHPHSPAVKSCVLCEAYLCDNHLRIHSKAPEHVLCDPTTSLEDRKCSVHKKILEYYCMEDSICICVSCSLAGEHRGHQVETLVEASEKKKKELMNVLQKLFTKREKTEKRVQSLEERRRKVQRQADDETKRVTTLFRDLRRHLEDLEKRVLREVSGQAEGIFIFVLDVIRGLEIKKDELSRKICHIEELCNKKDPLTVLQEADTGDLCDTEDGHDKETHDDGGGLDVEGVSHTLHTGLRDIMSGLNIQEHPGTHVYPHSKTGNKAHIKTKPSRPHPQPTTTAHDSYYQNERPNIRSIEQTSGVSGVADILLDINTASNDLHISNNRKTAAWTLYHNWHQTRERFQDCPQVLSSQSFSSGRHYWEVDVKETNTWRVGVCYPSTKRIGDQALIGNNKKSWGLLKFGNKYSVLHDGNEIRFPIAISSDRVRIDLDYEAGRVSFFELCNPIRHLHTFTTTFTEPLHAGVYVRGGYIKICGGNERLVDLNSGILSQ